MRAKAETKLARHTEERKIIPMNKKDPLLTDEWIAHRKRMGESGNHRRKKKERKRKKEKERKKSLTKWACKGHQLVVRCIDLSLNPKMWGVRGELK